MNENFGNKEQLRIMGREDSRTIHRPQGKAPYRPRPSNPTKTARVPAITHEQLLKSAIDEGAAIIVQFIEGERWRAKLTRMDKYTLTLIVEDDAGTPIDSPAWTIYKHAIRGFAVLPNPVATATLS